MVLLKYFKFKTTGKQPLPDLNGELSEKIPSSDIYSANTACVGKLVDSTSDDGNKQNLRGPYKI